MICPALLNMWVCVTSPKLSLVVLEWAPSIWQHKKHDWKDSQGWRVWSLWSLSPSPCAARTKIEVIIPRPAPLAWDTPGSTFLLKHCESPDALNCLEKPWVCFVPNSYSQGKQTRYCLFFQSIKEPSMQFCLKIELPTSQTLTTAFLHPECDFFLWVSWSLFTSRSFQSYIRKLALVQRRHFQTCSDLKTGGH